MGTVALVAPSTRKVPRVVGGRTCLENVPSLVRHGLYACVNFNYRPQFVSFYKFHRFVCVSAGDVSRKRCLPVPTVNVPQQGKVKSTAIVYTAVPVGLEEIWKLEPKRCCKSALLNFDLSQLRCTNSNLV